MNSTEPIYAVRSPQIVCDATSPDLGTSPVEPTEGLEMTPQDRCAIVAAVSHHIANGYSQPVTKTELAPYFGSRDRVTAWVDQQTDVIDVTRTARRYRLRDLPLSFIDDHCGSLRMNTDAKSAPTFSITSPAFDHTTDDMTDQLMTTRDVARHMQVDENTVGVLTADGTIPHIEIAGQARFIREDVTEALRQFSWRSTDGSIAENE